MDLSKIPNRLRGEPYFCLMKLELKPGKVKKDKVPYRTNGARADPTNLNHFTSLDIVQKVFDEGGYDGIGIGLFDDIIAIDIDDCVENGKLNDFATEIVEALKTYAEFSISGTGVHIWARAPGLVYDKEHYYFNNRTYGLEIYPAGVTTKFIVTTGNAINDYDINVCTDALKVILEKYMVRPTPDKPKVDAPGSYLSDESVIEKMLTDNAFDIKKHLPKRFAKVFGRAEENLFINGTGEGQPVGILNDTLGAETGVTTTDITFDDVINLYMSVKAKHRKHGVWLVNDETALALRKLKDMDGNYLWQEGMDTILGKPVYISEFMPSVATGKKVIAFGDFSHYWILNRRPLAVRALKEKFELYDQTGYLAMEYIDGKLVSREAIKVMQIS